MPLFPIRSEKTLKTRALASAVVLGLLLGLLNRTGAFRNIEAVTYDLRCRLFARPELADPGVVIIGLDDSSLESMGWLGWPWPRQIWADLSAFLAENGAKALFFDMTFETSSMYGAFEDSLFGTVSKEIPTVFIARLLLDAGGAQVPDRALIPLDVPGEPVYHSAVLPTGSILSGAGLLASPLVLPDPDGVVRRVPLFYHTSRGIVPSPGLALARISSEGEALRYTDGRLHMGTSSVPVESDGTFIPRYMGPRGTYRTLGADQVFEMMLEEADPGDIFRDAVVLVGYTAVDLFDLKPTPLSATYPGVEVHATVYDNIMTGRGVREPGPAAALAAVLVMAAAVGAVMTAVPSIAGSIAVGTALILGYAGAALLAFQQGLWLPAAAPLSAGLLAMISGAVEANLRANRQKNFIRAAFSQYLSPDVVARVVKDQSVLTLGGEKRVMTVFFSDVAGFTGISEKLEPERLVALLNHYLTAMTDVILKWGGTVDKFEGDAIIAFWGAPIPREDHAERACRAAMECQAMHDELNGRLSREGFPPLFTRIGMSTGPMVVGNMGSERRFDYTVMGDTVNLASRLEGVNKVYGTRLLVSGGTKDAAPNISFLELDTVMVVGQSRPVALFTPVERLPEWAAMYSEALRLYRQGGFEEAKALFSKIQFPGARAMADRCGSLLQDGSPGDWDGVWKLTSK